VFYTMWHMVASVLGCCVIMCFKRPETGWPSCSQFGKYMFQLIPISICTTANIACNNASLTMVSLFLNQVIKATGPLPTMIFSFLMERKTYGLGMILATLLIVAGTILAVPLGGSGTTSGAGVIIVIVSTLAASLKPVIMSLVMKGTPERPKLPATVVLFYDVFLSFFFMLIYWLASPERVAAISYLQTNGGLAVGLILAGATMAFLFNLSNYVFVQVTSALTTTVVANGVKILNIVISAIQSHVSAVQNWCGVALTVVSLIIYAYFSYTSKSKPPAKLSLPFIADKGAPGKTEATPLKPDAPAEEGSCCVIA